MLLLTLLVSPLAKRWRQGQLIKLRRPLGLWCAAWAGLHFMVWLGLDLQFDWGLIGGELVKRSYIVVGMVALLLLLALSLTSIPALLRRMGRPGSSCTTGSTRWPCWCRCTTGGRSRAAGRSRSSICCWPAPCWCHVATSCCALAPASAAETEGGMRPAVRRPDNPP